MERAKRDFENLGYIVNDVSTNESYDLHCIKNNEELLVDVNGIKSIGKEILMTANEVNNARNNKGKIALYILNSIQINDTGEAIYGTEYVVKTWDIETGILIPLSYRYIL
jgi:hypothetical protein